MSFEKWETKTLGDHCLKIGSGATPRGGQENYKTEGISLIRSQNVLDFAFSENGLAFIDDKQATELSNVEVLENDVLLNITGDSVARVCQVPKAILPARVNQHVAIIRPKADVLDSAFLKYYLLNPKTKDLLLGLASSGATRNALTKAMIENLEVIAPDIETQRRIAALLTALDDKIELNRRMNETLEGIAGAVWGEWFGQYAGGEELPEGWRWGKLGEFGEFKNGVNYGREDTGDTEFKIVSVKELVASDYILPDNLSSIPMDAKKAKAYLLKKDDIVIVRSASPGETALMVRDFPNIIYSGFAIRFRPNESVYKFYLFYLLQKFRENLDSLSNGTTLKNINQELLTNFECNYPPQNLIDSFNKICEPIMEKIYENHIQSRTLTALRDALLPRLMSGSLEL